MNKHAKQLHVRMSETELARAQALAKSCNLRLSDLVRVLLQLPTDCRDKGIAHKALLYGDTEACVRKVRPSDYCLFQAADMFCTLELARKKMEDGNLSKSEDLFFRGWRNLRKNYLKSIERKHL